MILQDNRIQTTTELMECTSSQPPLMSPLKLGQSDFAPIYKIVLTGGPCAGKTTALDRLSTFFRDRGFRVYMVPEASTILQTGGASVLELNGRECVLNFQSQILKTQISLEDSFSSLAKDSGKACVILCDRGAMDGSAYVDEELWEELKSKHDVDTMMLRDTRYNYVFHLVSAALGAESYYTLANNEIRIESIDEARSVDRKTLKAWLGHPKLFVFDNSTNFQGKMERLINTAARLSGLPTTVKTSRKYRLTTEPQSLNVHHEVFEVEKVYLEPESLKSNAKDYSFVRCRSQYGLAAYGMTTVRHIFNHEQEDQVDLKRVITAREYAYAIRHRADKSRFILRQKRFSFLYKDQSCHIHVYKEPSHLAGLAILHIQASNIDADNIDIPPFVSVEEELHDGAREYSAYRVSLKQ